MNDFNRKNKIIGFKPYHKKTKLWRKIFLALSENDTLQETIQKQTNENQVDNTHKTKDATCFMTEIIFIVVKTKRTNFGQPIWRDPPVMRIV